MGHSHKISPCTAVHYPTAESMKANGREPKSCSGRVLNFKLGCFVMCTIAWLIQARPSLELKIWPRFCPVSLSLSMPTPNPVACTIKVL